MAGLGHVSPQAGMPFVPYMDYNDRYHSPPGTAASSPRATPYNSYYPPPPRASSTQSPQRPATRAHFRTASANVTPVYGNADYASPRPPTASPRYDSEGRYATANVSDGLYSRNYPPYNPSSPLPPSSHSRRQPFIPTRNSTPSGESDEEFFNRDGTLVYTTASSGRYRRVDYHHPNATFSNLGNPAMYGGQGGRGDYHGPSRRRNSFGENTAREHATDRVFSQAGPYSPVHDVFDKHSPRRQQDVPVRPTTAARRPSMTTPQRPATTAPRSHRKAAASTSSPDSMKPRVATEKDAKVHSIPEGFSLKNWDPSQTPILLLGSVFDANSLGKWIYDWTVHHHGASSPEAGMAGSLWLILIQLYGKIRDGDQVVERVRSNSKRDILYEFLEGGDRLQARLRKLLKGCEEPMLRAAGASKGGLGSNSGVEFVKTLFGADRSKTQEFIDKVQTFVKRWEKNCDPIINNPAI